MKVQVKYTPTTPSNPPKKQNQKHNKKTTKNKKTKKTCLKSESSANFDGWSLYFLFALSKIRANFTQFSFIDFYRSFFGEGVGGNKRKTIVDLSNLQETRDRFQAQVKE